MTEVMRIGLGQFNELTDEMLTYIKQLGATDFLMNTPKLPGDAQWEYADLVAARQQADAAGLRLMALENVPRSFYDKAMLGLPGRDEQIAHMCTTIRNMGRAGIPILGYHWMPSGVWRTPEPAALRGDAKGTRFDMAEHDTRAIEPWASVYGRRDVGELPVLSGTDFARGRRVRCDAGAAPGRSASCVIRRCGASVQKL